ncbi:alpha-glucosidase [Mesoplasma seiffertii]|uniref:alpha-glucosidase n=1 Tax=Mesoplasma seiffertii TaxID=28224 RepID=UPI00047A5AA9|nr:alpha-glucosidase [Mesoplasma seiffertii]
MKKNWWKNTVVYELYLQSFYDSNNDGIGDIEGAIEKLDYLKNLGVGAIWLTPIYDSPLIDNGYDVADYQNINPIYGDIEKFKEFIQKAKNIDIKIIMDMVVNHTSDQHHWFKESRKSRNNPYRNYYIWRDKPDNTSSIFGGSAWTFDDSTNQYYFHQFAKEQPDLNWENPIVRKEIAVMIKWWCELGVMGFRFDVIDLIGKEVDNKIFANGPKLHQYIKELRKNSWASDIFLTVGECWGATIEDAIMYSSPNAEEFSMVFQFEHITQLQDQISKYKPKAVDFVKLKKIYKKWQQGLHGRGWNSLFLGNHDLPRMVSKYGNDSKYRKQSSKTLFTTLFLMQGTPYIFQGDEIGMTNLNWKNISDYKDVEIKNTYTDLVSKQNKLTHDEFILGILQNGRDHARTPFQWNQQINGGFSKSIPWIPINNNYSTINADEDLKDPNGIYNFLQKLIKFRNNSEYSEIIEKGIYVPFLVEDPNLFIYARANKHTVIKIIANWSEETIDITALKVSGLKILLNTETSFENNKLRPWQTVVLREDRF